MRYEHFLAIFGVVYPTLHQLLPIVVKNMRHPTEGESGWYAVLYGVLDYFAAGKSRQAPPAEAAK